jgi:hypothetical protein
MFVDHMMNSGFLAQHHEDFIVWSALLLFGLLMHLGGGLQSVKAEPSKQLGIAARVTFNIQIGANVILWSIPAMLYFASHPLVPALFSAAWHYALSFVAFLLEYKFHLFSGSILWVFQKISLGVKHFRATL